MKQQILGIIGRKWEKILIIVLLLFLFFKGGNTDKYDELKKMYEASNTETQIWRNKVGESMAKSEIVQSESLKTFTEAVFTDPEMVELQKLVKENNKKLKNGGSATIIKTETKIIKEIHTQTDTIDGSGLKVRISGFSDEWIDFKFFDYENEKDSLKLSIKNKYELVNGYEHSEDKNWLKRTFTRKDKFYSNINSKNIYDEVKSMKVYSKNTPKPSKLSVGLQVGYGFGAFGTTPYLGIGTNYEIFSINLN